MVSMVKPYAAAAAKSLQSCLTLCDPVDGSPPGSLVPGILQARTLEWVAISSSGWSHIIALLITPWGFPDSSVGKESACNAGDPSSIPGSGRSTGEGIGYPLQHSWASLVAQLVKNLPAMPETWVRSLGWEDPLEKGKATHSSILTWRIPWTVTKSQIWLSDFHTKPWRSDGISRPKIRQIELALPYLRVYLKCFMIFQDLIFWYVVLFSSLPGWLLNSSFKNGAGERPLIAVCYWGNRYFGQPSAEICGIWFIFFFFLRYMI